MDFQQIIKAILSANTGVSLSQAISITESILAVQQTTTAPKAVVPPRSYWSQAQQQYIYNADSLYLWARSLPEMNDFFRQGKKIQAIKALRDSISAYDITPGLRECKDAIDRYWTEG